MIITVECPSCVTSFPVDTDKVPESGVSARCSICASIFRVERPAQPERAGDETQADHDEASSISTATAVVDSPADESWSGADVSGNLEAAGGWDTEVQQNEDVDGGTDTLEVDVSPTVEDAWDSEVGLEPPESDPWSDDTRGPVESAVESESIEAPASTEGFEAVEEREPIERSEAPSEAEADWELSDLDEAEDAAAVADFDLVDPSIEMDPEGLDEPVPEDGLTIEVSEPEIVPDPQEPPHPEAAPEASEVETVPAPAEPPQAFQFGKRDPHEKAQRLARVLVSDMIMYNPERHDRALTAGTLKDDFDDEIKKSWEEYVDQVGDEIARSTPYFTDALNDILARGEQVFDDTVVG